MRAAGSVMLVIYLPGMAGFIVGCMIEGVNIAPTLACATIGVCVGISALALTNLMGSGK